MQTIIVIIIVIAAGGYLLRRLIKQGPGTGCACSCSSPCASKDRCSLGDQQHADG